MAISKALDEVKFKIPRQLLDVIFLPRELRFRATPASLDEVILSTVVRPRVLVDCNLVHGAEIFVNLSRSPFERTDNLTTVFRIPKSLTNGRSIMSVLNLTYQDPSMNSAYGVAAALNTSSMMQAASAVMDVHASMPVVSTAQIQLVGENVVMVRDTNSLPSTMFLRCIIAHDENMSHLQLKAYRQFAALVVLAVKAYLYNQYTVTMGAAELQGGWELGRFKDILDGYADAEELYQAYLVEKWEKISRMQDRETHSRFLKEIIGGYR